MNKTKIVMLAVITGLIIVAGVWYGINQQSHKAEQTKVIKIGALYGLTGDLAGYVKGVGKGIEYAVRDFQTEHPDIKVELVVEDDKSCDKVATVTGIQKLINVDGVKAVVGVSCTGNILAAGPIAEQSKILLMSGSASGKDVSNLGDYVFRTYSSDQQRSIKIANLIKERKYKKIDFVYEMDADSAFVGLDDISKSLGSAVEAKFYKVPQNDLDFKTVIAQIKNDNPDVIGIAFLKANQISVFIKQFKEAGIDKPLMTPFETVQDNKILEVIGNTELVYAIFTPDETSPQYAELKGRYKGDTGATEVPQYLAENYDGTMIVLQALYEAKGDTVKAQKLMYQIGNNYQGKSGTIVFDTNGDVSKMPALMTVKDGKFVRYEK